MSKTIRKKRDDSSPFKGSYRRQKSKIGRRKNLPYPKGGLNNEYEDRPEFYARGNSKTNSKKTH